MRPSPAIAAFDEDVRIPKIAQDKDLDYEGELSVVVGTSGKSMAQEDALSYIAGYAPSTDVSARKWQRDPASPAGVPPWSFAKFFDGFAPLGPMIVSPQIAGTANDLGLQTFVDRELRQDTKTDDLLFNVAALINFLSQGSTLQKGTVIMTGTPGGVILGMSEPQWLEDGDVVEVAIENVGSCTNKMVYEQT